MKEVSLFIARDIYCLCPYCNAEIDGWIGDPRGVTEKCDNCGKEFKVSAHADVEFE